MSLESEWVQQLGGPSPLEAMRELAGGVTATELRHTQVSDAGFEALVDGLHDSNPRVRWWCIQILDHIPDSRAIAAIATALLDEVPRVRRNAVHALGCVACKPDWDAGLPTEVMSKLIEMAQSDPNATVRREAQFTLSCRGA